MYAGMLRSEDNFRHSTSGTFCPLSVIRCLISLELDQVGLSCPVGSRDPSHLQGIPGFWKSELSFHAFVRQVLYWLDHFQPPKLPS